jgi:uncharacterized protein (TIGR04141 family)
MAKIDEPASPLSIYLLRPDRVEVFDKAFPPQEGLLLTEGWDGYLFTMQSARKAPSWEKLLRRLLRNGDPLSLSTESPGALLVVRLLGKTFVLAFGHAWAKLQDDWLEQSFGRRVALNSVDPEKLVEVNLEQVFAKWHLARERAPRASAVEEFDIEFDRDLVASIEGIASTKIFGKKLRGSTNLRVAVPFSDLRRMLESAARRFDSDEYKKRWPEIDNIDPIDDEALAQDLDARLDADLKSGKAQKRLVLFSPTYRHDADQVVDSYIFGRRARSAVTDAPSYCKETKGEGSNGRFREVSAACKAGALRKKKINCRPGEIDTRSGQLGPRFRARESQAKQVNSFVCSTSRLPFFEPW